MTHEQDGTRRGDNTEGTTLFIKTLSYPLLLPPLFPLPLFTFLVFEDDWDVVRDDALLRPNADQQRGAAPCGHQLPGVVTALEDQGKGSFLERRE